MIRHGFGRTSLLAPFVSERGHRRRPTVALLMIIVAACGLALGGGLWVAAMWSEVQARRAKAWRHAFDAAQWLETSELSAQRRVIVQRRPISPPWRETLEGMGYDVSRPYFYDWEIDRVNGPISLTRSQEAYRNELTAICRERASFHERMRRKWSRASWLPWTRVDPDPPKPPVDGCVTDQSY
jgi:hypothetical protein